jgi:hypothetical protein
MPSRKGLKRLEKDENGCTTKTEVLKEEDSNQTRGFEKG